MEVKPVQFVHDGLVHTIALYRGIFPEELSKILGVAFGLAGSVIGLQGQVELLNFLKSLSLKL